MIDDRHVNILRAIARYFVLNRAQIQRLCFPSDKGGRVTRRHIGALIRCRLLDRAQVEVVVPGSGSTAPAYHPTRKGCEFLVEFDGDTAVLGVSTRPPHSARLFHCLAVSETHIAFDSAVSLQTEARCDGWINEWDTINPEADSFEQRYRLYTLIQDKPKLVCVPDAAFLMSIGGQSRVYYLEQDRNTSGVIQVAATKTPGYAAMDRLKLQRNHFPAASLDEFRVLMVTPNDRRRDALKRAIAEKPGASLWRFASVPDLTPDRFLTDPIWHACEGEPRSLVRPKVEALP